MTTAQVTHLTSGAANVTIGLIVGFVILAGVVVGLGRSRLEGSFKARSGSAQGQGSSGQSAGQSAPDRTFMRSWLAIALVGGLLIFGAVSFQLDDTTLRSSLLGGVIASAGAATAFYFASKSADQARQDILNASFPTTTTPNLLGHTRSDVIAALAGTPLYLDASPTTAADDWIAVSQDPQPNQQTPTGSRVHTVFAGSVPPLNNLALTAAQTALNKVNLVLAPQPSNAAATWIAQTDQIPAAGNPPPPDRTVTVTFLAPP